MDANSFERFAKVCDRVAGSRSTLEKIHTVANYLRELNDENLEAATHFLTGRAFAQSDQRALGTGSSTILAAARETWHIGDSELREYYRSHGDLGAALAPFGGRGRRLSLFSDALTPASLRELFCEIADAAGKNAGRKRQSICEHILAACSSDIEAKYVIKIMTGELRIGLRDGLVFEGVSEAFSCDSNDVRRAVMASGDTGAVAVAARHGTLNDVGVAYGSPIGFMLASPIQYGAAYTEFGTNDWILEHKYDGIRAQLHKFGDTVLLFSRTLAEISASFPEVIEAARLIEDSVILDGELIAQQGTQALPFRYLQARLRRKAVPAELLAQVPVTFVCFDLLAENAEFLVDAPLSVRRERLNELGLESRHLLLAPYQLLELGTGARAQVESAFQEARNAAHEGLLIKRLDAPYHPGRRGKWWLKLKRELATLDVVVVAVEWGHGKRAKMLSDYTFAVRGAGDELLAIGKAYSGLTDGELSDLTPWFLEHRLPADRQREKARLHEIPVDPKVVIEIAFDIIQESGLHESGFALRFPRIVRIREDKPPDEIDTIHTVRELYREMLKREGSQ